MRSLVLALVSISVPAHADGWLVAEAPVALVTSDAQTGVFRTGLMPAVGLYAENARFAFGVRMRGGVLRNGTSPGGNLMDPGTGGLFTAGVAARISLRGGWIELVGGGGVTGADVVPSFEVGAGWSWAMHRLDVGFSARHLEVVSRDRSDAFGTARMALVGLDVRFGRERRAIKPRPAPLPPPVVEVATASDGDRIVDREVACSDDETCPEPVEEVLSESIVVRDDRIVLDERVLFAVNRARVRSGGRRVLAELARLWREHPEWVHMTIEGHADVRGTDDYNQTLSTQRAERVMAALVELGCPKDAMNATGFGRTKPRDSGTTDVAHERNRRVEFVIDRRSTP